MTVRQGGQDASELPCRPRSPRECAQCHPEGGPRQGKGVSLVLAPAERERSRAWAAAGKRAKEELGGCESMKEQWARQVQVLILSTLDSFAIFTVLKAGFVWSGKAGSGIVIARLDDGTWSAPSCIATGGVGYVLSPLVSRRVARPPLTPPRLQKLWPPDRRRPLRVRHRAQLAGSCQGIRSRRERDHWRSVGGGGGTDWSWRSGQH